MAEQQPEQRTLFVRQARFADIPEIVALLKRVSRQAPLTLDPDHLRAEQETGR